MSWSKDPNVVATTVFDPATQADYRIEGTLADAAPTAAQVEAPAPATEAAPATLPTSGGVPFDFTWVYLLVGSGLLGSGLYMRRR